MKIAWLTPFSRRSAIGQCSAVLVNELAPLADITVFASDLALERDPDSWSPDAAMRGMIGVGHNELLRELAAYDLCVYQLGDNLEFHRSVYELAQALPGITVLHDVVMHHFFNQYWCVYRRDPEGYLGEATFSHGAEGEAYARAVLDGTVDLAQDPALLRFNMAKSAIHRSEGVVVHSRFACQAVAPVAECPVIHIPFPAPRLAAEPMCTPSTAPKGDRDRVKLLTFGMVNPNKQIAEVIAAIAAHPDLRDRVAYRIIGSLANAGYARRLRDAIARSGLAETVVLLGQCSEAELRTAIAESDLIVNLRNPHFGESSWSLLEASFAGKPSLVWRHGYYDEFPDDAVAKVASAAEIGPRIAELCRDEQARVTLGAQARAFALETFSTAGYGDRLLAFAERTRRNRPVLRLTDTVAAALVELEQPAGSAAMELACAEIAALVGGVSDNSEAAVAGGRGGRRDL